MDALSEGVTLAWRGDSSMEERLRTQMQADMLVPLDDDGNFSKNVDSKSAPWAPETIEVAAQFLCLNVSTDFFPPHTRLTNDRWQARGAFEPRFTVFACRVPLLLLVWYTV
jgi:hypothetical protein